MKAQELTARPQTDLLKQRGSLRRLVLEASAHMRHDASWQARATALLAMVDSEDEFKPGEISSRARRRE